MAFRCSRLIVLGILSDIMNKRNSTTQRELDVAIDHLTGLFDGGEALAAVDAVGFLVLVASEIEQLRKKNKEMEDLVNRSLALFERDV